MSQSPLLKWWQRAVFYQIYPRSFADANGDGIGDLAGVIAKLDYLLNLGIDAIWLSPHYPSPQFDCGYDIADYTGVDPAYGTLDDFRRLLDEAHARDIRIITDLVLNHTSHQHPWFRESRSGRENPRRDWYIWRDGVDGGPPNDWLSTFDGSAWEYDPATGQYYYHFFFKQQPDLNWRNPEVKQAMFDAVRFWLDMGVDGFRLDALGTIFEDPRMPDQGSGLTLMELRRRGMQAQTEEEQRAAGELWEHAFRYQIDLPEVHGLMKELRSVVDEYDERVLVGETEDISYYGDGTDELHMVFNFPLMWQERLRPAATRENQRERLAALPPAAWPCNTLGNHDSPRVYNRFGDGKNDGALARLSLAVVLCLRGTPFLYYGEEIGMVDLILDDISQFRDLLGVWIYNSLQNEMGLPPEEAIKSAALNSRDRNRTPMQWGRSANAGFSPPGVETWLPVHPNHDRGVNVADQLDDPKALLNFYRALLRLRRENPALAAGAFLPLSQDNDDNLLVFLRQVETQVCLVVLNFSARTSILRLDPGAPRRGRVLFSTHRPAGGELALEGRVVEPFEILICKV